MPTAINLPRRSKGKRPTFFKDPAVDHLMAMVLELSAELSVVYTRLDTLERVLEEEKNGLRDRVEAYQPAPKVEAERAEWRELLLDRMFRTIREKNQPR